MSDKGIKVVYKLIVIVCVSIGGLSGCEMFMGTQLAEKFPPPGLLVGIDGRKLQIDKESRGQVT